MNRGQTAKATRENRTLPSISTAYDLRPALDDTKSFVECVSPLLLALGFPAHTHRPVTAVSVPDAATPFCPCPPCGLTIALPVHTCKAVFTVLRTSSGATER